MTNEAARFIAEALKRVKLDGDFAPEDIGKRIGFSKEQSLIAARSLSNAGILELGFDSAANFSADFRKMSAPESQEDKKSDEKGPAKRKTRKSKSVSV